MITISQTSELSPLVEPNVELNIYLTGPLDFTGAQINIFYFASKDFQNFHRQKLLHPRRQKQLSNFFKITFFFMAYPTPLE